MNNDTSRLRRPASSSKRRNLPRVPSPSVAEPRRPLLLAVLAFVLTARARCAADLAPGFHSNSQGDP